MGITELKREKAKADREIRYEISQFATKMIHYSLQYKYLGYKFRLNAGPFLKEKLKQEQGLLCERLFWRIRNRADKIVKLSAEDLMKQFNIDFDMPGDDIDNFLAADIEGDTTKNRIALYAGKLSGELEAFVSAGMFASLSSEKILDGFLGSLKAPFASALVVGAMKSGEFLAARLANGELQYGRGIYGSSLSNLTRLDYDVSQRVYVQNTVMGFAASGRYNAVIPRRSSIVPCSICDEVANRVFSLESGILPNHPRCICFYEPTTVSDLSQLSTI